VFGAGSLFPEAIMSSPTRPPFRAEPENSVFFTGEIKESPEQTRPDQRQPSEAHGRHWRHLLAVVLNVRDRENLAEACCALENSIFLRYLQLANSQNSHALRERMELKDACEKLAAVRIKKLGYGQIAY
jgi:hypothetical protein